MFSLACVLFVVIVLFSCFYLCWRLRFKNRLTNPIHILTYHTINDDFDWGITRQKISQFQRGMEFLDQQGYKSVPLEEAFRRTVVSSREPTQNLDRRAVITFDDGYEDVYLNAFPILLEYGFTAFVFIITGFVGKHNSWDYNLRRKPKRHLSWKQIREMSKYGFGFGSHTVNHPDLTKIDPACGGVEFELRQSKEVLEDKLGKEAIFLSYPFGRYNRFVQGEAERLGYKRAYTLCSQNPEDGFQPFAQPRWGVYLFDSPLTLRIKLNHNRLFWIEDLKGRIINRFSSATSILKGPPNYEVS